MRWDWRSKYARRLDLARATPRNELSSTGYCLAEPGVTYLVFAPEGGEFEVDLTAGDGLFSVEWRDAATGEVGKRSRRIRWSQADDQRHRLTEQQSCF